MQARFCVEIEGLRVPRTDWERELKSDQAWMRRRAACALAKMPHFARTVPEALAAAVQDRDAQTRRWAALALANIAPALAAAG